jgi:hypothetical protein
MAVLNFAGTSCMIIMFLFFGCTDRLKETPEEKFIGLWEVKGRSMFEGIQIRIKKEDDKLIGRVSKLNGNKYVKLFTDTSDVWVSEIKRSSNFEFVLTEKKIGKDLFSVYGLPTTQSFSVEFIDDSTIGLGSASSDPTKSSVVYKRIK